MFQKFNPLQMRLTKYMFFTGKGGVGKTSIACATAVKLADNNKKVLLLSTDPASNLQDVFNIELNNKGTKIKEVPNLTVINLNPEESAREYRENVIAPYRNTLPEDVIQNMEEQLSGSCTVEIAAFNEFSNFITNQKLQKEYDNIIFDTAPTGHTLRMLQLPSAWSNFISESTHGASCLGQLAGLEEKKDMYKEAVETLTRGELTTIVLVSRPEFSPLKEAERSSFELAELGINNQMLVVNGLLEKYTQNDELSLNLYNKQQEAMNNIPSKILKLDTYTIPLRAYNVTGIESIRNMLDKDNIIQNKEELNKQNILHLNDLIEYLQNTNKKVIFTMGKGGVGKTTIASAIALGLSDKGVKVHLTTTDPADHIKYVISESNNINISKIDEKEELKKYQEEVLSLSRQTMTKEDLEYIEEDLRSPCTQEIAVFRAFANIVEKANEEIIVIDTAPTGHTLLLLDSTQSYHREVERTQGGNIPQSVRELLPRLRNEKETEVIIITLPETTPVYEAKRLEQDLSRAGIKAKWWVINSSLLFTNTEDKLLKLKSQNEIHWINEVDKISDGNYVVVPLKSEEIKGEKLRELL
ncbi:MAG: arsenical pump-driving ATPase [Clostridia bacterium]|nr:arsenical pump-driving ATPase [Clostridia bacterium]